MPMEQSNNLKHKIKFGSEFEEFYIVYMSITEETKRYNAALFVVILVSVKCSAVGTWSDTN